MHRGVLEIGQGIGKGHSLRESGKEGLFPVPGTQSDFRRIIDNNCIPPVRRAFCTVSCTTYERTVRCIKGRDNTGIPLNETSIPRFHLQSLNESVNHNIKIILTRRYAGSPLINIGGFLTWRISSTTLSFQLFKIIKLTIFRRFTLDPAIFKLYCVFARNPIVFIRTNSATIKGTTTPGASDFPLMSSLSPRTCWRFSLRPNKVCLNLPI